MIADARSPPGTEFPRWREREPSDDRTGALAHLPAQERRACGNGRPGMIGVGPESRAEELGRAAGLSAPGSGAAA